MTQARKPITPLPSEPFTHTDNGILARVPGEYIAQAGRSLPDPATAPDEQMRVEIDAGWAGRVRLTFTKFRYRRPKAKASSVFWNCKHAEAVEPAAQAVPDES